MSKMLLQRKAEGACYLYHSCGGGTDLRMKRADVLLGAAVLLAGILWLCARSFLCRDGIYAVVELDGQPYGSYALTEDQEIDIGPGNHISIEDGTVRMTDASCPDHLCIRQGRISANGAMITCLPNRVTVQVRSDVREGEEVPDAIVY